MKQAYLLLMLSVGFAETAMSMENPPEDGIEKELSALLSPYPLQIQGMARYRIRPIAAPPGPSWTHDPYAPKEEIVSLIWIDYEVGESMRDEINVEHNNNAPAEEQECSICMELITHAEIASESTKQVACCKQKFHNKCLRKWLRQQQSCPRCRADAVNY